jgi:hypothetical protein
VRSGDVFGLEDENATRRGDKVDAGWWTGRTDAARAAFFDFNVRFLKLSGMALTYSEQLGPDLANATGLRQTKLCLRFPR